MLNTKLFPLSRKLQDAEYGKEISFLKSGLSKRPDIDQVSLAYYYLVFFYLEDRTAGGNRLLSYKTDAVDGGVHVVGRWWPHGSRLGFWPNARQWFHCLAAENSDALPGIDPVGVCDIGIFFPHIRPHPRGIVKTLTNAPQGVPLLHPVIESRFHLKGFPPSLCEAE